MHLRCIVEKCLRLEMMIHMMKYVLMIAPPERFTNIISKELFKQEGVLILTSMVDTLLYDRTLFVACG